MAAETGALNLAQGLPDEAPPREVLAALRKVVPRRELHQYAFTWGSPALRADLADHYARRGISADPGSEVTVTCGVSEALVASVLALTEPGDEVILLEPWYENYVPACALAGVTPRFVTLSPPAFRLDGDALAKAVTKRTRLVILNTPMNPTGRVFTREELGAVAAVCQRHGLLAVVDEIYERLTYGGSRHLSLATLPGMAERTVTLSGLGKTYALTGWRVGWAVARADLTRRIRKVHDYLTICAPAPLQEAGRAALALPDAFYAGLLRRYTRRRRLLLDTLSKAGFAFTPPEGAYYVLADAAPLGWRDDWKLLDHLARKAGVVGVPGSSFFTGRGGRTLMRFNFAKKESTLEAAAERLLGADLHPPAGANRPRG